MTTTIGGRVALLLLLLLCAKDTPGALAGGWVTGYYPRWAVGDMPPREMTWRGLTHVIHFGAHPVRTAPYLDVLVNVEDSLQLQFGNGWVWPPSTINVQDSLIIHAHRNGVKVLLSVGGIWGEGAKAMDYIAADDGRLATFVRAASAYARRKGYDGIEIDWEPPSSSSRMSAIVREFRRSLAPWSPRGILAVALANMHQGRYDARVLNEAVDQMNIMMYDYHLTPAWATKKDVTYYNAPLDRSSIARLNGNYHYGNSGPADWISAGFDPARLGLGIPFYGYFYKGRREPGEPRGGVWPQYMPYAFALEALRWGGERRWDEGAKVPWITGTAKQAIGWYAQPGDPFFITYDDSASIVAKLQWARSFNLGGVMIYELWQGWIKDAPRGRKDPLLRYVEGGLGMAPRSQAADAPVPPAMVAPPGLVDITADGTVIVSVGNPSGIGNKNPEVIRDGIVPEEGSGDPATQYDMYIRGGSRDRDWVGYTFASERVFAQVMFQEGMRYPDGGWLETLELEVRRSGRWQSVAGVVVQPSFGGVKSGRPFRKYMLRFPPVTADGIRVAGAIGQQSMFGSVAELRVYGPR